jgi:hypothetical protein
MFSQHIINFIVPGDRLFLASTRVQVDVVATAVPQQDTAMCNQLAN